MGNNDPTHHTHSDYHRRSRYAILFIPPIPNYDEYCVYFKSIKFIMLCTLIIIFRTAKKFVLTFLVAENSFLTHTECCCTHPLYPLLFFYDVIIIVFSISSSAPDAHTKPCGRFTHNFLELLFFIKLDLYNLFCVFK